MATRINAALRKRLVGSALGGLIAFAAVPGAMAQWLPPWRAGIPAGEIAHQLEAQGYMLIAPLQRRAGVYLADVRAGPAGYQRLVIDARNGGIIERFISPPRGFSPEFAARDGDFGQPPPGVVHPPGYGFDGRTGGTAPRSAYGGPAEVHIPTAISPYGQSASPKAKPPAATARKTPPSNAAPAAAPPTIGPPLPPPAPREATTPPEQSAPPAPKPEPKNESAPDENQNASSASSPATPEAKPEAPRVEPQPEAQAKPSDVASDPAVKPPAPALSVEASERSKTRIVPAPLFE